MSTKNVIAPACLLIVFAMATSCQTEELRMPSAAFDPALPSRPYNYGNADDPNNTMATLGRVLFYEKGLSSNNMVSCGSCHKQSLGFADNKMFSNGVNNEHTARNSMSIQNLPPSSFLTVGPQEDPNGYGSAGSPEMLGGLFWDGRAGTLQTMVLMPIQNPREMGTQVALTKISHLPYYQKLFHEAFGRTNVSEDDIGRALATFVSSIRVQNTTYDKFLSAVANKQPTDGIMSEQELQGMMLFQGTYNCNNCHQVELAVRPEPRFANIGLSYYNDKGLSAITGNSGDDGKFKVPSLRNIEFTGPYMHDGSLATLEDVIDHYSNRIADDPNLHPELKDETGHARKMNISQDETKALIAFLKTLSDKSSLTDPKFSDPFRQN